MNATLLAPPSIDRATSAALAWYCLHAQPRHESIAARALRQREEVEVFCPRIRFRRPRAGGQMWMTEALFPGYLFARLDLPAHTKNGLGQFLPCGSCIIGCRGAQRMVAGSFKLIEVRR